MKFVLTPEHIRAGILVMISLATATDGQNVVLGGGEQYGNAFILHSAAAESSVIRWLPGLLGAIRRRRFAALLSRRSGDS